MIIFKILAAPFVVVLTLLWAVMVFVFAWCESLLNIASGISGLLAVVLFITGQTTGGIVSMLLLPSLVSVVIPAVLIGAGEHRRPELIDINTRIGL